ncbi:hypothetical protein FRC12_014332, partial [Ceratobasidium sp. 428]
PLPGIPHNPVTTIWGDVPELARFIKGSGKIAADYFASMAVKHGPIFQIMAAKTPLVVIADKAEYERMVLKTKSLEQSSWSTAVFGTVVPTSQLSQPTNDIWKRHRRLAGQYMTRRYLERMSGRISDGASHLVRLWTRKVELLGTRPFDAHEDLNLAILDTILSITIGDTPRLIDALYTSLSASQSSLTSDTSSTKSLHFELPPLPKSFRAMMQIIDYMLFAPFPTRIARLLTWMTPSWRKSYHTLKNLLSNKIVEARALESKLENAKQGEGLPTDGDCVVDMMAQREAREGAEPFEDEELLDELITYVLGGHNTTTAALSWLLKYLTLDKDIQQRLHDEVCAAFGPGSDECAPLDFNILNDSRRVPVLEAVVAETLRCARTASVVCRDLIADEVVQGRHIPKGTQVMFLAGYMSMLESDWGPDAKDWRPSRWLREDGSFNSSAGPSYPFGIGQRSCFGQRLAVFQMKTFVAVLSRAFMFKQVPPELDSWESTLKVHREPKSFYVSLEGWPAD